MHAYASSRFQPVPRDPFEEPTAFLHSLSSYTRQRHSPLTLHLVNDICARAGDGPAFKVPVPRLNISLRQPDVELAPTTDSQRFARACGNAYGRVRALWVTGEIRPPRETEERSDDDEGDSFSGIILRQTGRLAKT